MIMLDAQGRSHQGRVRPENQDHFFIGVLRKVVEVQDTNLEVRDAVADLSRLDAHLLVVADGVGGVAGGRRASQSAVFSLATFIGRTASCHYDPDVEQEDEFLRRLEAAMHHAHQVVSSIAVPGRGPATTLTLALIVGDRAYLGHVGDSRAYLLRRGRLRQITRDQTLATALEDEGMAAGGQGAGLHNVLASAIGGPDMTPSIGLLDLRPDDVLLLCTDGLTKHVDDDQMAALLGASGDAAGICDGLIEAALAGGGSDNVTVVVARAGA